MAILVTLSGPESGRQYSLEKTPVEIGRHARSDICLEAQAVSRHHARITTVEGKHYIEDLESSNGTYLNGTRVTSRQLFGERDSLQIGPYTFVLRHAPVAMPKEDDLVIRAQVNAKASDTGLIGEDPAHKLQVILEISQQIGRTLDLHVLLNRLLDQLMRLFPQADRGMVLLCEGSRLAVRAQVSRRHGEEPSAYPYSRTIVKRALEEGMGILSEDVHEDERFQASDTLSALDMRSVMCVPLIGHDEKHLGVLQLDRARKGRGFDKSDLQLLTTVGLQTAVVLENAALHADLLREERLRQEVKLAREIQQGFLPAEFPAPTTVGYELYARVVPAREVSGDYYDFFNLPDGRLAFFIGDVSGKGLPAALFMVAARILGRHLASTGDSPTEVLLRLNAALAADNPSGMFVTMIHGIYSPTTGDVVFACAGHPAPLLRRADGRVESLSFRPGRMLGFDVGNLGFSDLHISLAKEETLILYTDGFFEAHAAGRDDFFGLERLREELGGPRTQLSLEACAEHARSAIETFVGSSDLQDDLTLFMLRRN